MSAYINGNLALSQQQTADSYVNPRRQPNQRNVIRRKSLPAGEKLLYLVTAILCFAVMGFIAYRYAVIYQVNTDIVKMEAEIRMLEEQSAALRNEAAKLNDPQRLQQLAEEMGLKDPSEAKVAAIFGGADEAVAMGAEE